MAAAALFSVLDRAVAILPVDLVKLVATFLAPCKLAHADIDTAHVLDSSFGGNLWHAHITGFHLADGTSYIRDTIDVDVARTEVDALRCCGAPDDHRCALVAQTASMPRHFSALIGRSVLVLPY